MMSAFSANLRTGLPTIYFVACFVGAGIGRNSGLALATSSLIVLISATVATLHLLRRQFPLQNLVGLAVTIAIFSGAIFATAQLLQAQPFRPAINRCFAELSEWPTPLLWFVALANSRSIMKLVLQRALKRNYGLWLIGLSSLLVASLGFSSGINVQIFLIQFFLALVALAASTPWFLDKRNLQVQLSCQPLFLLVLLALW